jgi:hypothetical protein
MGGLESSYNWVYCNFLCFEKYMVYKMMKNVSEFFKKILPVGLELYNKESSFFSVILGVIFFYFGYYIFSVYMFVTAIFLVIGLEKFKFNKQDLELEHHKIDHEMLPSSFELKIYHVMFIIISLSIVFFFNLLIGAFYLIFILFGSIGAFLKWNIYNLIPQRLYLYSKNFKKDSKTISYHWSNTFFFFKIFNRLTLISLPLGITVLAFALPFHQKSDTILLLNLYHAGILFCVNAIVSFIIDIYIIFFGNSSVVNKFGYFCYRCAFYGTGIMGLGHLTERQLIHNSFDSLNFRWQPTVFTNIPRMVLGKPMFLDVDQYWHDHVIRKYLPHITYDQYSAKYNNIVSQIDSTKTNEIIKENWGTLAENCTKQELNRIRLGQGYISSTVQRR